MKATLLSFLKLICFILLLPFIAVLLSSFYINILAIGPHRAVWFLYGAGLFIAAYLFLYNFKEIQEFAQNMIVNLFGFAKAIATPASLVIPLFATVVAIAYAILSSMEMLGRNDVIGLMAISFFWTMHVVLTAHQLQEAEKAALKGGYFFGFGLALIIQVVIAGLLLALVIPEFSLANFAKDVAHQTAGSYKSIYHALFVPKS